MENIVIKEESQTDQKDIYEVHKVAFKRDNEAQLVDLLRQGDAYIPGLSLIAIADNKLLGHILFSKIAIVDENSNKHESLALAPISVHPGHQNKGIGGKLIQKGLERAKELGYKSVIVLGHEKYYPKFGFKPAENWKIKAPFDVPSEVFMAIELVQGGLDGISGTVEYPKEFLSV